MSYAQSRGWLYQQKLTMRGCRPRPSLRLCLFEEGFVLDFFGILIALTFLDRFRYDPEEIMDSWGVYYAEGSVVFCWNNYCKFINMPWNWQHVSHEVRRADGTWVPFVGCWENKPTDGREVFEYSYTYVLKSGEVQNRWATVYVDRMEWRQWWLKWCPLFAKKRQSIDVTFDGEVGEKTGSWKGGTIGCGWDIRRGETPEHALRRMERERIFN